MPIVDAVTPPSSPSGYHYEIVLITASTTLTENHRDRLLQVTGTVTITLPNDLPIGFHCKVERYGSGAVTLSAASGATLNNAFSVSVIESRYEVAEVYVTANGNGLAAVYNVSGLSTATAAELDILDGLTATTAELNGAADVSERLISVADAGTYAALAANSGKPHVMPNLTATCTITLPAPAIGLDFEFIYGGIAADAQNWIINTGADIVGDDIVPIAGDGNSNSKVTIVTPDVGTRVRAISNGTLWILNGQAVSATVPSFADQ